MFFSWIYLNMFQNKNMNTKAFVSSRSINLSIHQFRRTSDSWQHKEHSRVICFSEGKLNSFSNNLNNDFPFGHRNIDQVLWEEKKVKYDRIQSCFLFHSRTDTEWGRKRIYFTLQDSLRHPVNQRKVPDNNEFLWFNRRVTLATS